MRYYTTPYFHKTEKTGSETAAIVSYFEYIDKKSWQGETSLGSRSKFD